ncbi:hypothetical protein [Micromonospora sp.]
MPLRPLRTLAGRATTPATIGIFLRKHLGLRTARPVTRGEAPVPA